jgi:membrane-associated phospholipid phosphatase
MHWLQTLDESAFRFVNSSVANPFFDWLMPFASSPPYFGTVVALLIVLLIWKGGRRGPVCAVMLLLGLIIGDSIINVMKHAVARPRPFLGMIDVTRRVGIGASFSMPSAHAANCFSAMMITFFYYRRSIRILLPVAVLVGLSRIYNGVHYPSDVLVGAILGAGYGAAIVWSLDALWKNFGPKWFPIWFEAMPSLMVPNETSSPRPSPRRKSEQQDLMHLSRVLSASHQEEREKDKLSVHTETEKKVRDLQWLRFGYVVIGALLLARLLFLASGKLELSEDEAYQWIWSKHPALSYYSKPLMIAYTQWLGTHIWGDTEFGVRFFSPVFGALLSVVILRFVARVARGRAGVWLIAIITTAPLMALGSILMTIDPLSVFFYTLAMIIGWRAIQETGTLRDWLIVGAFMGLGLLSKYTNLFQLASWALVFAAIPTARKHLRTPGPYLALLIVALCSLPIVIWNRQHGWITVEHVATDGNLHQKLQLQWKYVGRFLSAEFGLLNPFWVIGTLVAVFALCWRRNRTQLNVYLFNMGAPVVFTYFLLSFHTRILENWIVPAVIPWFMLTVMWWQSIWPSVQRWSHWFLKFVRRGLRIGIVLGLVIGAFVVVLAHDTRLLSKMLGRTLPPSRDPLHRVHGWKEMAAIVGKERAKLEAESGKPTFIIGEHYGFTAEVTFYLPEAKTNVVNAPLVYFYSTPHPMNQFYFWPSYTNRVGDNAILMMEVDRDDLRKDWFKRWWNREGGLFENAPPKLKAPPPSVVKQFDSVTNIGVFDVNYRDLGVMRRVQLYACRNLK